MNVFTYVETITDLNCFEVSSCLQEDSVNRIVPSETKTMAE